MPPERPTEQEPPVSEQAEQPQQEEERLHELFAGFRAWLRPTRPGRRKAVLDAVRKARRDARAAPSIGRVLGSAIIEVFNIVTQVIGYREPTEPRSCPPDSSAEAEDDD